jgi:WD repeat and SOF domain-containing protein 1
MVRIATISHDPSSSVIRTANAEHNFSRAREFQRAFNATKLHKIFAKPFLGTLEGHSDGISVISKCSLALNKLISGAHDG